MSVLYNYIPHIQDFRGVSSDAISIKQYFLNKGTKQQVD